jgi:hypothetical protein
VTDFGKWSQQGVPHKGWQCTHIEDLGEPIQTCEMCERQTIRYVHFMSHPNYPMELECGCDCAGKMEENAFAAEAREKTLKNRTGRRRSWSRLKGWHRSQKGNMTITKDGYRCTVFQKGQVFKGSVSDLVTKKTVFSKKSYPDEAKVMLALFDYVEALKTSK